MNERRGRRQRRPEEARATHPRGQGPRRSTAWHRGRTEALRRNRPPDPTLAGQGLGGRRKAPGLRPGSPAPDPGPPLPAPRPACSPGGRARPRRAPGARRLRQGDRGRGRGAHLLSGAHVVLAEQAADALREGVDRAAVAVLLGAAAAPCPLHARGQQPEQQQQQEPSLGPGSARRARAHPGAGGMRGPGEG